MLLLPYLWADTNKDDDDGNFQQHKPYKNQLRNTGVIDDNVIKWHLFLDWVYICPKKVKFSHARYRALARS